MKKILLSLTMVLAIVALASCSLNSKTTIEFTKLPETVYEAGVYSQEEINAKLAAISVKVSNVDTEIDLTNKILTVSGFDAATLKTPGSYNLVVVYGSASVVFSYTVVAKVKVQPVSDAGTLQAALDNGGVIELTAPIKSAERFNITKSVVIYGNNYQIEVNGDSRVFNLSGNYENRVRLVNLNVNLNDLELVSKGERCISLYYTENIELNIKNCKLTAETYTLNIASYNEGTKVNIEDSVLNGWGLINSYSNGSVISIKNSELNSYNGFVSGDNTFGAIVFNGGARDPENLGLTPGLTGQDNNITLDNCKINVTIAEASVEAGLYQFVIVIQDSCAGNVFNFNKCEIVCPEGMLYLRDSYNPAANEVYFDGVRK